jgi:hypothetical protein
MATAKSTFEIQEWSDSVWDDAPGAKLGHARLRKAFHGEIQGTSVAEILTAHTDTPAAYVGLERLSVSVHGKSGTFVLHHSAGVSPDGQPTASWTIVANSGTGALAGISGAGQITRHPDGAHSFVLDYQLPETPR